eukprot:18244-Eustigmatos_ZCMA.PRE.1
MDVPDLGQTFRQGGRKGLRPTHVPPSFSSTCSFGSHPISKSGQKSAYATFANGIGFNWIGRYGHTAQACRPVAETW